MSVCWVKAKDDIKLPTMHRTGPLTKNYPFPDVTDGTTEKPWPTQRKHSKNTYHHHHQY